MKVNIQASNHSQSQMNKIHKGGAPGSGNQANPSSSHTHHPSSHRGSDAFTTNPLDAARPGQSIPNVSALFS